MELRRPRKRLTPAQKVAKIEELIDNDELAKALKTVMQKQGPNSDANRISELRDLFPKRSLLDNVTATQACWTGEFEESVEDAILELLRHLPRGSGAGPDGSRYEHWGADAAADVHAKHAAKCMRLWVQGQAPDFAYERMRKGRLLAIDKKDGGLRPLVLCTVFRRIALRGLLNALKADIGGMVGPQQFAMGKPSGDVMLSKALDLAARSGGRNAVLSIDIKNAFGTMARGFIDQALAKYAPKLAHLMGVLYASPSTHVWSADGGSFSIEAGTGVDQGCPFSMLAFAIGLRAVQENVQMRLSAAGIDAVMLSYADDTYIACEARWLDEAERVWKEEAAHAGMQLADRKRAVWVPEASDGISDDMEKSLVVVLPVLGHTAERNDLQAEWAGLGERSQDAWARACQKLQGIMAELQTLVCQGLSRQSASSMLRLWTASVPQHVARGKLIGEAPLALMDDALADWWCMVFQADALPTNVKDQMSLPLAMGGFAAGGMQMRGPASFLSCAMQTYLPAARMVGFRTLEEAFGAMPEMQSDVESAIRKLEDSGVKEDLRGWLRGRSGKVKGAQRRWMRTVQEKVQQRLLSEAPPAQVLGIRSGGGRGAGAFLQAPRAPEHRVSDSHFEGAVRARAGLPLCPQANQNRPAGTAPQCQHRPRRGGPCCGAQLDDEGKHAAQCETGGHVLDRHDDGVKLLARRLREDCNAIVATEQRRPELDYVDENGRTVAAVMDLVVTTAGRQYLVDLTYTDIRTADPEQYAARLRKNGAAARRAEDRKRRRYPADNLVPLAIESGGRIGDTGMRWLQMLYKAADAAKEWQNFLRELSAHTQASTAAIVIAAIAGA